jgi:plastocyanin
MRTLLIGMLAGLMLVLTFGLVSAESTVFSMGGSGAAVINSDNPKLYSSIMHINLSDSSTVNNGGVIVRGSDVSIVARFVPNQWTFTYGNDGSFHGEGIAQTSHSGIYNISVDGTRIFATTGGSMWKVSAIMQNTGQKFVLEYLLTGNDPVPSVSVSNTEHVLIPNGNSAQANTGFFIPLNLEIIRGTTVIWQNEDNIGHTVQSQDAQGNIIPLFNSPVLNTGDTFTYKFDKPGVYHYFCSIHPWRIGVVTVS